MSNPDYNHDVTLDESNLRLEAEGYTGQFGVQSEGQVQCFTCREMSAAEVVAVDALRRLEGASDPDDMIVVAAVSCPKCGAKGTLVLKYGPEATPEESEVLRSLEDGRSANTGGTEPTT